MTIEKNVPQPLIVQVKLPTNLKSDEIINKK